MDIVWLYSLLSVFAVSLMSLVGILLIAINENKLKQFLLYTVSFSAGALFGDAFFHLIPSAFEDSSHNLIVSIAILSGIALSFVIEKFVCWRHCHHLTTEDHPHPFVIMNLVGDGVHNFLDGLIIGASYLVDVRLGFATTIAVVLHEIPQEIGDFGVLLHGGFSKAKGLFLNFLVALTAVVGVIVALVLAPYIEDLTVFLVPFAAGGFVYIAGSDLIPELHKESGFKKSAIQFFTFILGMLVMLSLIFVE